MTLGIVGHIGCGSNTHRFPNHSLYGRPVCLPQVICIHSFSDRVAASLRAFRCRILLYTEVMDHHWSDDLTENIIDSPYLFAYWYWMRQILH